MESPCEKQDHFANVSESDKFFQPSIRERVAMRVLHRSLWIAFILGLCAPISSVLRAGDNIQGSGNLQRSAETVGEKVPSEDDVIKGLHSLGLINGRTNIFRCASPVKDL